MIRVKRVRHTALATSDLEHLLEYYQSVIGLGVVSREGKCVYLGSDSDQLTTIIEQASDNNLGSIAFEVAPDSDLGELQRSLTDRGIASEIRSDSLPGISRTLTFSDPDGHRIDLFAQWQFCKSADPLRGWSSTSSVTSRCARPTRKRPRSSIRTFSAFGSPTASRKISSSCAAASSTIR
jgi:catechol 2,3-dioxygenase-like lactoylglutathione lyase family enzyme